MATPRGVFELKYFFTSGVGSSDGEGASSEAVKARIKALIDAEDPAKILSDLAQEDIDELIDTGQRTAWPKVEMVRTQTAISRALESILARLDKAGDDADEATRIGVEIAAELCSRLLEAGAPGLHFYTLNRANLVLALARVLRSCRGPDL